MNYAQEKDAFIGMGLASDMARAFCQAVRAAGYDAMNYANPDYLNRYFDESVRNEFPIWLSQWPNGTPKLDKPPRMCGIWQYSNKGRISGITGPVDLDVCYVKYQKKEMDAMSEKQIRYNKISEMPGYAQPIITKMVDNGILGGSGTAKDENNRPADLDLSMDMIRVFVTNDRAGLYGSKN